LDQDGAGDLDGAEPAGLVAQEALQRLVVRAREGPEVADHLAPVVDVEEVRRPGRREVDSGEPAGAIALEAVHTRRRRVVVVGTHDQAAVVDAESVPAELAERYVEDSEPSLVQYEHRGDGGRAGESS
jgi:hypothetical protein